MDTWIGLKDVPLTLLGQGGIDSIPPSTLCRIYHFVTLRFTSMLSRIPIILGDNVIGGFEVNYNFPHCSIVLLF